VEGRRPTAPTPSPTSPSRRAGAGRVTGIATPGGHPRRHRGERPPHVDCTGRLALIHNGIIENHVELADELVAAATPSSRTPTPRCSPTSSRPDCRRPRRGLAGAVRAALGGARRSPSRGVGRAARPGRAAVASRPADGVSEGSAFLASESRHPRAHPGVLHPGGRPGAELTRGRSGDRRRRAPVEPNGSRAWTRGGRKDGYDDYMSKEMHEQPRAVADTLLDRLLPTAPLPRRGPHLPEEFRASTRCSSWPAAAATTPA